MVSRARVFGVKQLVVGSESRPKLFGSNKHARLAVASSRRGIRLCSIRLCMLPKPSHSFVIPAFNSDGKE